MNSIYSVGQVNAYIKNMFSQDFLLHSLTVRGEVSNCTYHSSGHIYFTIKDTSGTLSCIMFAGKRKGLTFQMKEGDGVLVHGTVDVFERDGRYQLYADKITPDGVGALNERYEQLKKKLEEEGLFDERYKKKIPPYIRTLGVITAPTGAAVRDIIQVSLRRNPYLQILLYPAIVQGDEAPASLIRGLMVLAQTEADVIILGRGGGSLEDLWGFNDEQVARAVFDCPVPVISAVGHETDTVITDYVADLRAPTPSAAAELAVFDFAQFEEDLQAYGYTFRQEMARRLLHYRDRARLLEERLKLQSPAHRLREQRMKLVQLEEGLRHEMLMKIGDRKQRMPEREAFRRAMEVRIAGARDRTRSALAMTDIMRERITKNRHRMELLAVSMEKVSPVARLSGGYSYVTDAKGKAVRSVEKLKVGDEIRIRLQDGAAAGTITQVEGVNDGRQE